MWNRRLAPLAGALVATVLGALAYAPAAPAQTACWERVLDAWSGSTLGPAYPPSCYRAALVKMPDDVRDYSSASDDIERALLAAIKNGRPRRQTAGVRHLAAADPASQALRPTPPPAGRPLVLPLPFALLGGCCVAAFTALAFAARRAGRPRSSRSR
jgi:hypothetical protein